MQYNERTLSPCWFHQALPILVLYQVGTGHGQALTDLRIQGSLPFPQLVPGCCACWGLSLLLGFGLVLSFSPPTLSGCDFPPLFMFLPLEAFCIPLKGASRWPWVEHQITKSVGILSKDSWIFVTNGVTTLLTFQRWSNFLPRSWWHHRYLRWPSKWLPDKWDVF